MSTRGCKSSKRFKRDVPAHDNWKKGFSVANKERLKFCLIGCSALSLIPFMCHHQHLQVSFADNSQAHVDLTEGQY